MLVAGEWRGRHEKELEVLTAHQKEYRLNGNKAAAWKIATCKIKEITIKEQPNERWHRIAMAPTLVGAQEVICAKELLRPLGAEVYTAQAAASPLERQGQQILEGLNKQE